VIPFNRPNRIKCIYCIVIYAVILVSLAWMPLAKASGTLNTITEDIVTGNNSGTPVSDLVASFTGGSGNGKGIAVTGADTANGTWEYSTDEGSSWVSLTGVSLSTARLLPGLAGSSHGYAEWYCFVTGTATYSIVDPNGGVIYDNSNAVIVSVNAPARGVMTITAGKKYRGSVPINLVAEDNQHAIAPISMKSTKFWNYTTRNAPTTYYVYSPEAAVVKFYHNVAGGFNGTPTSTVNLSAGEVTTFSGSSTAVAHMISSDKQILVTASGSGGDKTVLSPMDQYVYNRYYGYSGSERNTTPSTVSANVVYDANYSVMSTTIADGSGGDTAQGLGLNHISSFYSWGNILSDYAIAAPNGNTDISVYYWSSGAWVLWE